MGRLDFYRACARKEKTGLIPAGVSAGGRVWLWTKPPTICGEDGIMKRKTALLAGMVLACGWGLGVVPVQAAGRAWAPQNCGSEPVAPAVDVSTVERYNASVDKVTAYQKEARAYNSCVVRSAMHEETAISEDAKERIAFVHDSSTAVQKRIAANFEKLTATLKAGNARLQKAAQ